MTGTDAGNTKGATMGDSEPRLPDERNRSIVVYVDGTLWPRDEARISVFDSVVQGGDAVWEGLRVYDGRIAELEEHLDRLYASAHALAFTGIPDRDRLHERQRRIQSPR